MRWTAARRRVTDLFAPSVARRVDLQMARYRDTHLDDARGWITVDGEQIASFDTRCRWKRFGELQRELGLSGWSFDVKEVIEPLLVAEGLFSAEQYLNAVYAYPSVAFDDALSSPDPIIRALAMLDRRLGKRRLVSLALDADEQAFVRRLMEVRRAADGLRATG